MLQELLLYISIALVFALVTYPFVRFLSFKYKLIDKPGGRKVHTTETPRVGGLMIFLGFIISYLISQSLDGVFKPLQSYNSDFSKTGFIIAACCAFLLGFIDDIKGIRARIKLFFQFVIGFIVAFSGLKLTSLTILDFTINFGFFSYLLTAIWVVAFLNAVNFIDGLDGLAAGMVIIALCFSAVISAIDGNYFVTLVSSTLAAATIGFFVFNFYPAKVFMGDGGAYFLGCMYAMLSLMGMKKSTMAIMFAIPLVLLLIPLADILYIIIRRAKKKQDVFKADKNHIHHRLLGLGLSVRQITMLIYLVCIAFGLIALLIVLTGGQFGLIFFFLIISMVTIGFGVIRILEKK
jgi:UDP-GlcNAc:undecaprenyl-phosphate/decaprenyl-phosphate GlcNAc-1-phosphate transferase